MNHSDLLACAARIAPSGLARVRILKDNALGTLVPPGREGKHLVIAVDGKRGPPVRRLAKDVELVERARLHRREAGANVRQLRRGGEAVVHEVRRCFWHSSRTAALAPHRIAVWEQVLRAGVVRHDVASLPAPSRAAGSATARNAVGSSDIEIVDFRASQVAAWAV